MLMCLMSAQINSPIISVILTLIPEFNLFFKTIINRLTAEICGNQS